MCVAGFTISPTALHGRIFIQSTHSFPEVNVSGRTEIVLISCCNQGSSACVNMVVGGGVKGTDSLRKWSGSLLKVGSHSKRQGSGAHTKTHACTHTLTHTNKPTPTNLALTHSCPPICSLSAYFFLLHGIGQTPEAFLKSPTHTHSNTHSHRHTPLEVRADSGVWRGFVMRIRINLSPFLLTPAVLFSEVILTVTHFFSGPPAIRLPSCSPHYANRLLLSTLACTSAPNSRTSPHYLPRRHKMNGLHKPVRPCLNSPEHISYFFPSFPLVYCPQHKVLKRSIRFHKETN